jgi:hypothetical protein
MNQAGPAEAVVEFVHNNHQLSCASPSTMQSEFALVANVSQFEKFRGPFVLSPSSLLSDGGDDDLQGLRQLKSSSVVLTVPFWDDGSGIVVRPGANWSGVKVCSAGS